MLEGGFQGARPAGTARRNMRQNQAPKGCANPVRLTGSLIGAKERLARSSPNVHHSPLSGASPAPGGEPAASRIHPHQDGLKGSSAEGP